MMTAEIRINGTMIGHIYCVNESVNIDLDADTNTRYRYEYYEPETRRLVKNHILFDRTKGARALVSAILSDITTRI